VEIEDDICVRFSPVFFLLKLIISHRASLTARLFFERLLDYDQYFTWFLASLDSASLNMLPVWLLMLGIYWNSILRYRKRGRRLAELLLEKLQQVRLES
jgi:mediator of RNA polymerase II transcription subunit 12